MTIVRTRMSLMACALISFISYPVEKADASGMACSERGASYHLLTGAGGVFSVDVSQYDALSWQAIAGNGQVLIDIGAGFQNAPAPGTFSTHKGLVQVHLKIDGDAQSAVSCVPGSAPSTPAGIHGDLAANSQTSATSTGVGTNAKNRFMGGSNVLSGNLIYVSTSNLASSRFLPADWNAWAGFEGRAYSGGIEGQSFDFVGGVDTLLAPDMLVGVLGGLGRTFVTDSGTPETSTSPMIGAYFGKQFSDTLIMDGFLSWARPGYEISGASFNASRVSAGLTLTGQIKGQGGVSWEPFLFARGYQEQQPTYTTGLGAVIAANASRTFAASLGVRVKLTGQEDDKALVPYFSAAADYKFANSTLGGTDLMIAPRLGLGVRGDLGKGQVSVDFDIGKARSDTFDRGLKLGYEVKF